MDCLMMSHCLSDCFLYDGLQDYLLGIWGCQKISTWEHKQNLRHHCLFWTFLLCCFSLHNNFAIEWFSAGPDFLSVASLSWNAWTILSRPWLCLSLLRYADDLVLYKQSWFAQRLINLIVPSWVHYLFFSTFFEGLPRFRLLVSLSTSYLPFLLLSLQKNNKQININKK